MKNTINKRIACLLLLSMLGMTACTTAPTETTEPDPYNIGTPESTVSPAENVDELFAAGDKDYFVPFQDPDHSFCTITQGWGTPVRTQRMGGCYAYAAVAVMQSNYLKEHGELIDLNPDDLIGRIYVATETDVRKPQEYAEEKYYVSDCSISDLGGDYYQITGSLCADKLNGYLMDETIVFGSYNCSFPGTVEVTEDEIKDAVKEYGAICLTVHYSKDCKMINGYYTQNHPENAEDRNHVAAIVGWDDNFPAECFSTPASRNGAWLVQNSFGEIWGNCGYYWVSYDMPIPSLYCFSVTSDFSDAVSYGRYMSTSVPSSGLIDRIGDGTDTSDISLDDFLNSGEVTVATVFNEKGSIGAIGIWTTAPGQTCTIEILDGEFGRSQLSLTRTFDYAGYHTVYLAKPLELEKYTVVVTTTGEYLFEGVSQEIKVGSVLYTYNAHYEAKTDPGRSFILIGEEWVDVTDPDIMTRLGLDGIPAFEGITSPGDPCITVLFY